MITWAERNPEQALTPCGIEYGDGLLYNELKERNPQTISLLVQTTQQVDVRPESIEERKDSAARSTPPYLRAQDRDMTHRSRQSPAPRRLGATLQTTFTVDYLPASLPVDFR
jgi:hypothetical protein